MPQNKHCAVAGDICNRPACVLYTSACMRNIPACRRIAYSRNMSNTTLNGGIFFMKVVVVKSPKFLRGILRLVFGIKKESEQ